MADGEALSQAHANVERMGPAVDSMGDAVARSEAKWANLKTRIGEAVAPMMATGLETMADEITGIMDVVPRQWAKLGEDFSGTVETVKIVGAIFEGKLMDALSAKVIASLPGREVLLARLVGSMKSPISGFHRVLHSLLRNFVYAVSEVQKKKSAGAVSAAAAEASAAPAASVALPAA